MKTLLNLCLSATVLLCVANAPARAGEPLAGGLPDLASEVVFQTDPNEAAPWQATVFSYAYVGTSHTDAPQIFMPEPGPGNTLFVYVVRMTSEAVNFPAAVTEFVVSNTQAVPVLAVGYSASFVPPDFSGSPTIPTSVFSSTESKSVVYGFTGSNALDSDPDEPDFAVLWFLAEAPPGFVSASIIGGQATTDVRKVVGPAVVPEPAMASLLLASALLMVRRRRR